MLDFDTVVGRCAENYRALLSECAAHCEEGRFPKRFENGELKTVPVTDWCSGFFAGTLWHLFNATGDAFWRDAATAWTDKLIEPLRHDASNHDVGFRTYCSAGNALRATGDAKYADFLHDTAAALRTRYSDKLGLICSWNSEIAKPGHMFAPQYVVIIDNMMNLELLEWDAKNGGSPRSAEIAKSQADSTDAHHFRPNGSAFHILGYNRETGRIHAVYAGQGADVEGAWARGQAWAVYGFTMMYRETGDTRYLERAVRSADYWLSEPNLPADGVPYWDFSAVGEERDASAAAVFASALLELCGYAEYAKGRSYLAAADKILDSLASPAYFAATGEIGGFIVKHCVGHKPGNSEVDVPLNYADYYFLEALLRRRAIKGRTYAEVRADVSFTFRA